MTHLKIEQNTTGIEEVSNTVIKKLYDLVYSGILDNTSNLLGRLHTTSTYQSYVDYLTGLYPNLYITANKYYMSFADPLVEQILLQHECGDGTGITLNDAAGYRIGTGELFYRQPITSFDEFLYFTSPSFTYTASLFCLECSQLTSITYPPLMQVISGNSHLENTSLTSIDLRNTSLTTISNGAFYGCTALTTVNIPDTCTTLGNGAFENCTNLSSIDLSHITTFGNGVLRSCVNLTTANLYNATSMGTQCFMGSGLTSVDFTGSTITSIPTDTFNGCTSLTTVTLPSTITVINSSAFKNCTALNNISSLINITNIAEGAFSECTSLTSVIIPHSLAIGNRAFENCTNLGAGETMNVAMTHEGIPAYAFKNTKYKKLIISNSGQPNSYDCRYPMWSGMSQLEYLDISDFKIPSHTSSGNSMLGSTYGADNLKTFIVSPYFTKFEYRVTSGFSNMQHFILLHDTPPVLLATNTMFTNTPNVTIYVKDATAKAAFLADSDWNNFASKIDILANLPVGVWNTGLYQLYEPYLSHSSDPIYTS